MESVRIVGLCVLAAVTYGVVHDQFTARICVEYFTIGHPPLVPSESPTVLALAWGVVATWWVGLPLGALLAVAARSGAKPKLLARELRRPIVRLLIAMAIGAALAGSVAYVLARTGVISLQGRLATLVPADRHARFLADLWAHSASYALGLTGGLAVCVSTFRGRGR